MTTTPPREQLPSSLMQHALEALEYHQEQTRPIEKTQVAIAALREALSRGDALPPLPSPVFVDQASLAAAYTIEQMEAYAREALRAQAASVEAVGWKLVPIKCTSAMKDVGIAYEYATVSDGRLLAQSMWNELLAASPTHTHTPADVEAVATCRTDGRCQYAIDHGVEDLGHCPIGKCVQPESVGVAWIDGVLLDVAELPDRTSPDDQPDMMLVTADELRNIIEAHAPAHIPADVEAPQIGSVWTHTNGNQYEVLHIGNEITQDQARYPVSVVYKGVSNGLVWTRALSDWHRSMTLAHPPQAPQAVGEAARDVLAERQRQISAEGWAPEHDDEHDKGELAVAAAIYALIYRGADPVLWVTSGNRPDHASRFLDSVRRWVKSGSTRRNLIKAGALILAEIERLDRAALATKGQQA